MTLVYIPDDDLLTILKRMWGGAVDQWARDADALSNGIGLIDGNERNGIGHTHTSVKMAREHGIDWAETIGDLKEGSPNDYENGDEWKDQYNNEIGRQIAKWMEENGYTENNVNPDTGSPYTKEELDGIMDDLVVDAHENGDILDGATEREILEAMEAEGITENNINPETGENYTAEEVEVIKDGRIDDAETNGTDIPLDENGDPLDPKDEAANDWDGPTPGTKLDENGDVIPMWQDEAPDRDYSGTNPDNLEAALGVAIGAALELLLPAIFAAVEAGQSAVDAYNAGLSAAAEAARGLLEKAYDGLLDTGDWLSEVLEKFIEATNEASPLVFDLDGDGVELVALDDASVYWDLDQDGLAEASGWVAADDGLLALDLNGDGFITTQAELFGTATEDGFSVLRVHDENLDGVIDVNDAVFGDLVIWRDLNQNGVSEADELFTLDDLNITSINLDATDVNQTNQGHAVTHVSSFTVDDGSGAVEHSVQDVWFQYDDINTRYAGEYELDLAALFVPALRGYGNIADTYVQASLDNDTDDPESLLSLLQNLQNKSFDELFTNDTSIMDDVQDILYRWAGVDGIDPRSRSIFTDSNYFDSRKLEFLEELAAQDFYQNSYHPNPRNGASYKLLQSFDLVLQSTYGRLLAQTEAGDIFEGDVFYNLSTDTLDGITGLNQSVIDALEAEALGEPNPGVLWQNVVRMVENTIGTSNLNTVDFNALDSAIQNTIPGSGLSIVVDSLSYTNNLFEATNINGTDSDDIIDGTPQANNIYGQEGDDYIDGGPGFDVVSGGQGDDILIGGAGDDYLLGGRGRDTYVYELGHSQDTIGEFAKGGDEEFDTIKFGAGIDQEDVDFSRFGRNDLVIDIDTGVQIGQIVVEGQFNSPSNGPGNIEFIEFDNGDVFSLDAMTFETYGSNANDFLNGVQIGGSSDDIIYGNDGNDTIYGADTLTRYETGINYLDGGDGDDFLIGARGASDTLIGGNGADELRGQTGDDLLNGGVGDDILLGDGGNDTYIYNLGDGNDQFYEYGTDSQDTIVFGAGILQEHLTITRSGNHHTILDIDTGTEVSTLVLNKQFNNSGAAKGRIELLEFDDGSQIILSDLEYVTYGTEENDYIVGINIGGNTSDTIFGLGGDDTIYGADGPGRKQYTDNILDGGSGNDALYGDRGADILIGGEGADILWGNLGNDTADYTSSLLAISVDLQNNTASGGDAEGDILTSIENVMGSNEGTPRDYIWGNSGVNHIQGQAGNDILEGGAGADTIDGGAGWDYSSYGRSNAAVNINLTTGVHTGGHAAGDVLIDVEAIIGSAHNDTIIGSASNDFLKGGAGDDVLDGAQGFDLLYGENGNDIFHFDSGNKNIYESTDVNDGGIDRIVFSSSWNVEDVAVTGNTINFIGVNDSLSFNDISLVEEFEFNFGGTQSVIDLETLQSYNQVQDVDGTMSDDVLYGTSAAENFDGLDGNDTVDYSASAMGVTVDLLNNIGSTGDAAGDTYESIENVTGSDITNINGSNSGDTRDWIWGDEGVNVIQGLAGNDILEGDGGADILDGGTGWDYARYTRSDYGVNIDLQTGVHTGGDAEGDTLIGIEAIVGSHHNDIIGGGSSNDYLNGGNGDDVIYGAAGADMLIGGNGADVFLFKAISAIGNSDKINDFDVLDGDVIDIADVLQPFYSDPNTQAISDFVEITTDGTHSFLSVDVDGGANDFTQIAEIRNMTGLDLQTLIDDGNLLTETLVV